MRFVKLAVFSAVALAASAAIADPATRSAEQSIRNTIKVMDADISIRSVEKAPMPGLYRVTLDEGEELYATPDGQYVFHGYVFQNRNGEVVNLTEETRHKALAAGISGIKTADMVIYPAKDKKTHITVFTDPDCPYCRKLHGEVDELSRLGIEVRYVAFPRMGLGSESHTKMSSIWCAEDRAAAMNLAMEPQEVPSATCANPVAEQFNLGKNSGVQGTPTIIMADGRVIGGFAPAAQIANIALGKKAE